VRIERIPKHDLLITDFEYRIESDYPLVGPLIPEFGKTALLMANRSHAIAVAAKSNTSPYGHEIRVVHVSTGEVTFRKTASTMAVNVEET
jgi:hypothetical protein